MSEYPLSGWGLMAKEHWRKHLPNLYQSLEAEGMLEKTLYQAQENAITLYMTLTDQGTDARTAQELALQDYILLPAEGDEKLEPWELEDGESNQLLAFENFLNSLS